MEDEQARTGKMGKSVSSLKKSVVAVCAVVSVVVGTAVVGLSLAPHSSASPPGQTTLNVGGDPSETAVYSSLISPLPGNIPSIGVESDYFDELGNEVNLASSGTLSSVVVTMSSFTCGSGSGTSCVTERQRERPTRSRSPSTFTILG